MTCRTNRFSHRSKPERAFAGDTIHNAKAMTEGETIMVWTPLAKKERRKGQRMRRSMKARSYKTSEAPLGLFKLVDLVQRLKRKK